MGTWVSEITDRETHTRQWLGSFHTNELAAMVYGHWQVHYHDTTARLNSPFGTRPIHLFPPEPGMINSAMAREDHEARERLEVEVVDEAYMQELHLQREELVEAERMIFAHAKGDEIIVPFSVDEVVCREEGGEVGSKGEKIDVDECMSVFPDDPNDGTGPDLAHGTPYVTRKDLLDLTLDRK
ncbi:Bifunctional dihydroflavonol 4-reductase/flavanone 4-reductase [Hordeum vulgare]|nr:Bifunctional dihydroflavonol 4-reductase/flavanone 4-reductase [Hordeum vulgare]